MIDNALKIDGWMEPNDLEWLADKAKTHMRIAEVGCWMGRSTTVLADNTNGTVWAIDHWQGSEEHAEAMKDKPYEWLYHQFCTNMHEYILKLKVVTVKQPSVSAAKFFMSHSHSFDMVFIDASHDFESVRSDIAAWRPLLVSGGLLCGHDAGHPPIMQATRECFGENVHHEQSMWVADL
jgi:predicted O-methyltransferase YrrM